MLEPILRITLYRLVAYPVSALGIGSMARMVRGMKTNAIPAPWLIWCIRMSQVPDSRLIWEKPKKAMLDTTAPKINMARASHPLPRRIPTMRHANGGANGARAGPQAGRNRRPPQQRLHEKRQQDQAAVKHESQQRRQHQTGGEVTVSQQAETHDGLRRIEFADHEGSEHDRRDHGQHHDKVGAEPILLLAFVQHDLQRRHAHRQHAQSPQVHAQRPAADVRGIVEENAKS